MPLTVAERPSPNHGPRADGVRVSMVVLHYTGMPDADAALARLTSRAAEVSAHYFIDEDGAIARLVAEDRRAWHAGRAFWRGATDVNSASIGIELVNPGHAFGYRPFPASQIDSLCDLLRDIRTRHDIDLADIVGHSDVAPDRKSDPGELFPWPTLARRGLSIWPASPVAPVAVDPALAGRLLGRIGYIVADLKATLTAFQRRFRPSACDGVLDPETMALVAAVAARGDRADA